MVSSPRVLPSHNSSDLSLLKSGAQRGKALVKTLVKLVVLYESVRDRLTVVFAQNRLGELLEHWSSLDNSWDNNQLDSTMITQAEHTVSNCNDCLPHIARSESTGLAPGLAGNVEPGKRSRKEVSGPQSAYVCFNAVLTDLLLDLASELVVIK